MVDFDYLESIANRLCLSNGYDIPAHKDIKTILKEWLKLDNSFCVCKSGCGAIMGSVYPYPFNPDIKYAYDVGFWVEPELRGSPLALKLIVEFEKRAKELGASKVVMVALNSITPDRTCKFYSKLGYKLVELNYVKEI